MTITDHDVALAHHQRAEHLAAWLRDLLAAIDEHGEDVPAAVHKVAGYARTALNRPLFPGPIGCITADVAHEIARGE